MKIVKCTGLPAIISLTIAAISVATAIGFLTAAMVANGSFWGAVASPGLMLGAAIASTVAVASIIASISFMVIYMTCLRSKNPQAPSRAPSGTIVVSSLVCGPEGYNWYTLLAAIGTILGLQAVACYSIAGIAVVPWAPLTAMGVVLSALILQGLALVALVPFSIALANCLKKNMPIH